MRSRLYLNVLIVSILGSVVQLLHPIVDGQSNQKIRTYAQRPHLGCHNHNYLNIQS